VAILIASSIGFLSVIANVISPEKVFLFLLNSSGAVALFVYLLICVSQLVMRRKLEREDPDRLKVRMWLYPYLTYFAIAAIGVVIVSMALVESVRSQLYLGLLSVGVVLTAYFIKQRVAAGRPGGGEGRFTRERETAPVQR
jgi:GABA permease